MFKVDAGKSPERRPWDRWANPPSPKAKWTAIRSRLRWCGKVNGKFRINYSGKATGDEMKITASIPAMDRTFEMTAKRAEIRPHNGGMARVTELLVNGSRRRIDVDPDRTLLSVLRDDLDLTGAKFGCGEGQCAACTVLIDGVATKSCLTKIGAVAGKRIVTIEGLAPEGKLHPVQQAFLDADALQCGYCTPGMILGAVALLEAHSEPQRG